MSIIRFNLTTKEIELEGPESFIESNFAMIRHLLAESVGVKKPRALRKANKDEEQKLSVEIVDPLIEKIRTPQELQVNEPEVPQEMKVKKPPILKYILRRNGSSNVDQVLSLIKEVPEGISLASLKEKFGLTEQQIEAIIRDAEKQGRIRKDMDGSYVWV